MMMKENDTERGSIVGVVHAFPGPPIHSAHFPAKKAAEVAGIDPVTLRAQLQRGLIDLENKGSGRGVSREFSACEVVRIRLMQELSKLGLALSTAFKVTLPVKNLWKELPDYSALKADIRYWLLIQPSKPKGLGWVRRDDYYVKMVSEPLNSSKPHAKELLEGLGPMAIVINAGEFLLETLDILKRSQVE